MCEPDQIHISQELQQLLSGHPEFMCKNRGEITLKGREVMQTFWLYRNPSA
ncbi:MAG: adenylate/guanylate cyclase domain-containing protein [Ignavibacteria bacterium]